MNRGVNKLELLRGTLDMLILRTLLVGPAHGHQIARHIQRSTEDVLQVEHGSLYPALHRLEQQGLAGGEMGEPRRETRVQVLPAERRRPEAAGGRRVEVETAGGRHRAGGGPNGGLR